MHSLCLALLCRPYFPWTRISAGLKHIEESYLCSRSYCIVSYWCEYIRDCEFAQIVCFGRQVAGTVAISVYLYKSIRSFGLLTNKEVPIVFWLVSNWDEITWGTNIISSVKIDRSQDRRYVFGYAYHHSHCKLSSINSRIVCEIIHDTSNFMHKS